MAISGFSHVAGLCFVIKSVILFESAKSSEIDSVPFSEEMFDKGVKCIERFLADIFWGCAVTIQFLLKK